MGLKTVLFLVSFVGACGGALYLPLVGVVAYMMHYQIGPEWQWWSEPISSWGIRYSFILALLTAVSIAVHHRTLRYGRTLLTGHEWLMVLFVAIIWLSTILGLPHEQASAASDYPPYKMAKVLVFTLMLTHVATTVRAINVVLWTFVAGGLFLGYEAYTAPAFAFFQGRLETLGGPDFRESNAVAAYMAASLAITGAQFLRTGWRGKGVCLIAGVLACNGIILTRSRAGLIAIGGATLVALFTAPRRHRILVLTCVAMAALGAYFLTDPAFWERMSTITAAEEERDSSAQHRLDIWRASLPMFADHPFGIGAANFTSVIGDYDPSEKGFDSHSSYVRCFSELGVQGILVFLVLIASAMRLLWRVRKECQELPEPYRGDLAMATYGVGIGLGVFLLAGLTATNLYHEGPWWFMAMPVCLLRAVANAKTAAVGNQPHQASLQTGAHHGT